MEPSALRALLRRLALALGVGAVVALVVRLFSAKKLTYSNEAPGPAALDGDGVQVKAEQQQQQRASKSSRDVLGRKKISNAAFISHAIQSFSTAVPPIILKKSSKEKIQ